MILEWNRVALVSSRPLIMIASCPKKSWLVELLAVIFSITVLIKTVSVFRMVIVSPSSLGFGISLIYPYSSTWGAILYRAVESCTLPISFNRGLKGSVIRARIFAWRPIRIFCLYWRHFANNSSFNMMNPLLVSNPIFMLTILEFLSRPVNISPSWRWCVEYSLHRRSKNNWFGVYHRVSLFTVVGCWLLIYGLIMGSISLNSGITTGFWDCFLFIFSL